MIIELKWQRIWNNNQRVVKHYHIEDVKHANNHVIHAKYVKYASRMLALNIINNNKHHKHDEH